MTLLTDILDPDHLARDIELGYIREQSSTEFPYRILNYTEKAQFDNHWDDATLACRGLIYNETTNEIVARPFPKFFNYSQLSTPPAPETSLISVTDKADGSLGIIYHGPDDTVHVATRGSFASDQALWATQWINNHDVYHYSPEDGRTVTLLVEIIYPENRIVLDYGTRESLVLLGAVEHTTGRILDVSSVPESWWSGDRTESFPLDTLADVLEYPDRENSEGLVALTRDNQLIKFKQEDYVKLHRILTGLTERTIYDLLVSDSSIEDFIELIPDEFHEWVKRVAYEIKSNYEGWLFHWDIEYKGVVAGLPEDFTQKDFALAVKDSSCRGALFLVHKNDTERLEKLAWREVRPEAIMATSSSSS